MLISINQPFHLALGLSYDVFLFIGGSTFHFSQIVLSIYLTKIELKNKNYIRVFSKQKRRWLDNTMITIFFFINPRYQIREILEDTETRAHRLIYAINSYASFGSDSSEKTITPFLFYLIINNKTNYWCNQLHLF